LVTPTCGFDSVRFTSTPANNGDHWDWNFGDGTFDPLDNQQTVAHSYSDTGTFNVSLTIFNGGCPSGMTPIPIRVLPPIPRFGYKVNCTNGVTVNFIDSSEIDN